MKPETKLETICDAIIATLATIAALPVLVAWASLSWLVGLYDRALKALIRFEKNNYL